MRGFLPLSSLSAFPAVGVRVLVLKNTLTPGAANIGRPDIMPDIVPVSCLWHAAIMKARPHGRPLIATLPNRRTPPFERTIST